MPVKLTPELLRQIEKKNLRYISDSLSGIKRIKDGKKFKYIDPNDVVISNKNTFERIEKLVIPPAWKNVWISPLVSSHLQATGIDQKGRKQYIYHTAWTEICQENKFKELVPFGQTLPKIRRRVQKDLNDNKFHFKNILATVVWLLEHTFIRVGNDEYAKENNSYGLTTLRMKHITINGRKAFFKFKGKSGVDHFVEIDHPRVVKNIKRCIDLPGYELFQFINGDGRKHIIDSADVNRYLQDISGRDISAKDFRTWGATNLSADTLYQLGEFENEVVFKKHVKEAVRKTAGHLRNTPSVCRKYYIHPTVIKSYEEKILIPHFEKTKKKRKEKIPELSLEEFAVLTLIKRFGL